MKYVTFVATLLLLVGCTNTHRIIMVYESDLAASGTRSIVADSPAKAEPEAKQASEEVKEDEASIFSNVRSLLP